LNNQPKIDGTLRNNQIVGKILSRWGQNWWCFDGNKIFELIDWTWLIKCDNSVN
jgi:hypothetical protein